MLERAQEKDLPGEDINVRYGLEEGLQRRWHCRWLPQDEKYESQQVVLVAFNENTPVGYIGLELAVCRPPDEQLAYVYVEPSLVYVAPAHRGLGYGLDLSIAAGWICRDLVDATYNAVPSGSRIDGELFADYESERGEVISQYLFACLEWNVDRLKKEGARREVSIGEFILDAGY